METDHKRVYTVYTNRCFVHLTIINMVTKRNWEVISDNFQAGGSTLNRHYMQNKVKRLFHYVLLSVRHKMKYLNLHFTAHCGTPRPNTP